MATRFPAPPPPLYGPNGERVSWMLVKKSPVRLLHSDWRGLTAVKRVNFKLGKYRFLIACVIDEMLIHPNCLDGWKPLTRTCTCKCMKETGLGHGSKELKNAVAWLIQFAMMPKQEQQLIMIQLIQHSSVMKEEYDDKKVFFFPGSTTIRICRNAIQRLLGVRAKAWRTCQFHADKNTVPVHGLTGRVGLESNRGKHRPKACYSTAEDRGRQTSLGTLPAKQDTVESQPQLG